jgi:hypothetical protein
VAAAAAVAVHRAAAAGRAASGTVASCCIGCGCELLGAKLAVSKISQATRSRAGSALWDQLQLTIVGHNFCATGISKGSDGKTTHGVVHYSPVKELADTTAYTLQH